MILVKTEEKKIINTVSTDESEAVIENCTNGVVPSDLEQSGLKKIRVPVVTSMTKYLFSKYRLQLYSYLNRLLRSGWLSKMVGLRITNHVINKAACNFIDVSYWRIDRLNFYADVRTRLTLSTPEGTTEWNGYLVLWVSAEVKAGFEIEIVDLYSYEDCAEDRKGMIPLDPFLIPILTSGELDRDGERIWGKYMPEALTDPKMRSAYKLAEAMGLKTFHHPIHEHGTVDSVLILIEDKILVDAPNRPEEITIDPNSIVVNTNNVKRDYSAFNIFHEIMHFYEHYLFFRLQEMHNNDVTQMETEEIEVAADEKIVNPLYWMEKQANRGAYALMMPRTDFTERLNSKVASVESCKHSGERYEKVCDALGSDLGLPAFRVRARIIQMGHMHAKGAVNYVEKARIRPFSFEQDALCSEELTFVIDRRTSGKLFEENKDYKAILDTGKYIYADGHIVKNNPRFVVEKNNKMLLTDWAEAHVDQCCLRFIRVYVQKNAGNYVFGRMYCDTEYVKQTSFYLDDMINQRALDEIDAKEQYIREFPKTFEEAFNLLVRRNNLNREDVAEWLYMDARTLDRWLAAPDTKINADFVMFISLKLQLPDWICELLFKRAHIQLDDENKRHLAFKYIQRVLWMDGVEKANEYLKSRKLEEITVR